MKITEIRIVPAARGHGLLMGASATLDGEFCVHDLKVIDHGNGLFVSMPAKKVHDACPECKRKNPVTAKYCNECGARLDDDRIPAGEDGRKGRVHMDIAHPVTQACRDRFEGAVLDVYEKWLRGEECRDVGGRPIRISDFGASYQP